MKQSQLMENNPLQNSRKFNNQDVNESLFEMNVVIRKFDEREEQIFKTIVDSVKHNDQLRAKAFANELVQIKILKTKLLIIQSQLLKQVLTAA